MARLVMTAECPGLPGKNFRGVPYAVANREPATRKGTRLFISSPGGGMAWPLDEKRKTGSRPQPKRVPFKKELGVINRSSLRSQAIFQFSSDMHRSRKKRRKMFASAREEHDISPPDEEDTNVGNIVTCLEKGLTGWRNRGHH